MQDLSYSIPDLVTDSDYDDDDSAPDTDNDDDDDADHDYRPSQPTEIRTTDKTSLQLLTIVPPSALPPHFALQFHGSDSDSVPDLMIESDSNAWPDFVSSSCSDTNSLPDLIYVSIPDHISDSDSQAPTLRRIQLHNLPFHFRQIAFGFSQSILSNTVPDDIPSAT